MYSVPPSQFIALEVPVEISATNQRPADWLCCLALLFGCNLFQCSAAGGKAAAAGGEDRSPRVTRVDASRVHKLMTEVVRRLTLKTTEF